MATRGGMGRKVKPSGGYELAMWYFMRLSGLALVFLAVGHLFIMHIVNNVETINYAFVASRWTAPRTGFLWRLMDLSLITLAVTGTARGPGTAGRLHAENPFDGESLTEESDPHQTRGESRYVERCGERDCQQKGRKG